jgi:hypothetical protein
VRDEIQRMWEPCSTKKPASFRAPFQLAHLYPLQRPAQSTQRSCCFFGCTSCTKWARNRGVCPLTVSDAPYAATSKPKAKKFGSGSQEDVCPIFPPERTGNTLDLKPLDITQPILCCKLCSCRSPSLYNIYDHIDIALDEVMWVFQETAANRVVLQYCVLHTFTHNTPGCALNYASECL